MAEDEQLVSVIIPAFNRVSLLGRAVSSALNQTYPWLEVIIVDDGSGEDVKAALSGFSDPRLSYHRRDENKGISAARNHGISLAKGKYLAFLDSDDEWRPTKIGEQVARLRGNGPGFAVCYTNSEFVDDVTGKTIDITDYRKEGDLLCDLLHYPEMDTSSLMVEREALADVDGFDERIHWGEDWDLYIRLAEKHRFACVQDPLTVYHLHDRGRVSDRLDRNPVIAESLELIYRKNEHLFRKDRRAWSEMLVMMGYYEANIGQKEKAMKVFLKSIRTCPMNRQGYVSVARLAKGWDRQILRPKE